MICDIGLTTINCFIHYLEISNSGNENKCYGQNEEWDWCGCSDFTCENPRTKTKVCISCVPGCYCKEGFARYSNGECIDIGLCRTYII